MSGTIAYLDSSAFVKLVIAEPETQALRRFLRAWPDRISSALLRAESLRAIRRFDPAVRSMTIRLLKDIALIDVTRDIIDAAAALDPPALRTLDAIHLATGLSVGDALGVVLTYDQRLAEAASAMGLAVAAPV